MPVHLVLASPAGGKTYRMVQQVRLALARRDPVSQEVVPGSPSRPDNALLVGDAWVIVPDRLQAAAFRRLLARTGGSLGVNVATFNDVYREALECAGSPVPLASDPALNSLVRLAAAEVSRQGLLTHYARAAGTPGFIHALRQRFVELKGALADPQTLLDLTVSGDRSLDDEDHGLEELARIYLAHQRRLQTLNWADSEGLSWLAIEAMQADPGLLSGWSLLVVDGFDDFNPAQRRTLELLAGRIPEVWITFPGADPIRRSAHRRFQPVIDKLCAALHPEVQTLTAQPHLPPPLAYLEGELFERRGTNAESPPQSSAPQPSPHLHLLEARSPSEEAREALRWMKAHILRTGVDPEQCAVFTPQLEAYLPHLFAAAQEFGLRVHVTHGQPLRHSPEAAALLEMLSLPDVDYPPRPTLDTLRSPYFDWSACHLEPPQVSQLELVVQGQRITGKRGQWEEALNRLAASEPASAPPSDTDQAEQAPEDDSESLENPAPSLPLGDEARRLGEALRCFFNRLAPPGAQALSAWVAWLEDLLDETYFPERCDTAPLEALRDVLRALILEEQVAGSLEGLTSSSPAGGRNYDYAQWIAELRQAIHSAVLKQDPSDRTKAILIGRMLEARGVRYRAVALLGLAEGIFPEIERPDPFLDEATRQRLAMDPRLGRNQAGLFYLAVTRADEFLLLSRPYLAADGAAWEPSPYWNAVRSIFPGISIERVQPEARRDQRQAASRSEVLLWAARQGIPLPEDPDLLDRSRRTAHGRQVLQARLDRRLAGGHSYTLDPYEGYLQAAAPSLQQRYGPEHVWSVSRLESYANCPYRFFLGSAMELELRLPPQPGLDGGQLGRMLHRLLEQTFRFTSDRRDVAALTATLEQAAAQEFSRAAQEYSFRPGPLWEVEQAQILEALRKTVAALVENSQDWEPVAFELGFGFGGSQPVEIAADSGDIKLHGVIDRIDRRSSGDLRVIDYKTGASSLDNASLLQGRSLQLPLYALAVQQAFGLDDPVDGLYWGILQGEPAPLQLSRFACETGEGIQAAVELAVGHAAADVDAIRRAEFPPEPPARGCAAYCPGAQICWQYQPAPDW